MRLIKFITEAEDIGAEYEQVLQLKKDCSQFFNEISEGQRWWRGSRKGLTDTVIKKMPRLNRKPKDTPENIHAWLDDFLKKKFGWKPRSEGVFVATNPYSAEDFGPETYMFFPCNGYKYIWSSEIDDLTEWLNMDRHLLIKRPSASTYDYHDNWYDEDYRERVKIKLLKLYTDKGLDRTSGSGSEIMFNCKKNGYYMMKGSFFTKYYYDIYNKD